MDTLRPPIAVSGRAPDPRLDDETLRGARQRFYGVGPGTRWGRGRTAVIIDGWKEFGAVNRSEGYQGVLRVLAMFDMSFSSVIANSVRGR